ncbi:MAG: hypothetical protein C4576_13580 [Desulfobacteraceae bacterium]|nr:MAG: hypothetical protein C4576_13580 [Desulfobacteraceae bacterium]
MTAQEIQKRNEKAQTLRVIEVGPNVFYVESAEGKICYKVLFGTEGYDCSCGDFARNRNDPSFKCKHIAAVEGCVPSGEFETAQFLDRRKPKLDERFIMSLEGNDFVKYAGLLDLGHQKGIMKIEVDVLQFPSDENKNTAVCRATVVSKTGEVFIDIGDANPSNTNSRVSKHLLRMASTRSIARALRTYTNIGMTCLEELADFSDAVGTGPFKNGKQETPSDKKASTRKPVSRIPKEKPSTEKSEVKEGTVGPITEQATLAMPAEKVEKKDTPAEKPRSAEQKSKSNGTQNQADRSSQPKMSEAQKRALYNLSRRRGISVEEMERMSKEKYHASVESLTSSEASEFIRSLQQAA